MSAYGLGYICLTYFMTPERTKPARIGEIHTPETHYPSAFDAIRVSVPGLSSSETNTPARRHLRTDTSP